VKQRSRPGRAVFCDLAIHGETVYDLTHEMTARTCSCRWLRISGIVNARIGAS
jgi:hypothetical protein